MSDIKITRRPLKTRSARWASVLARLCANGGLKPNQISIASVVFAFFACDLLAYIPCVENIYVKAFVMLGAAACIQLRLLCNLLDGMVAVECGLRTKSGEVFNDFPDRISDTLILIGAGFATDLPYSTALGTACAILALFTAYTRILGGACGLEQKFTGPMAKPHRMAVLTAALIFSCVELFILNTAEFKGYIIYAALAIIAAGAFITIARRLHGILTELENKQ